MVSASIVVALLCKSILATKVLLGQQILGANLPKDPLALFEASFVEVLLKELHVPGISVAVVHHGHIAADGYGEASFPHSRATADTLYHTGSTTKAFTAAVAALLVQNQTEQSQVRLGWNTPIHQILSEDFALIDDYATTHITLEDALSHRSGLPRHDMAYSWGENSTSSSIVKTMRYMPLTAEPRTLFQYCNLMYVAVTDLLQKFTGRRLETILQERFWDPLGMCSTTFSLATALKLVRSNPDRKLARGFHWVDDVDGLNQGFYVPEPYLDLSTISGAGATISTVNDYALWIKAFLEAGDVNKRINQSSPITRSLYREVVTPRTILPTTYSLAIPPPDDFATPGTYALGWMTATYHGHTTITHSGSLPGFGAEVWLLPDDGFGVVTMGNTELTSNMAGRLLTLNLVQRMLGLSGEITATESGAYRHAFGAETQSLFSLDLPQNLQHESSRLAEEAFDNQRGAQASLNDYIGTYFNPAYGNFNITAATHEHRMRSAPTNKFTGSTTAAPNYDATDQIADDLLLHIQPAPRIWSYDALLQPYSDNSTIFFSASWFTPHGPFAKDPVETGDGGCTTGSVCRNEVVWASAAVSLAAFDYGPNGDAQRFGVEIEGEMVRAARAKQGGESNWREGMIWFDKVG